jgi:long-chain-fatty-acid--[acyl-carrier-protein] ligase
MMKKFLFIITYYLLKCMLWFRYRIKIEGLENINSQTLKRPGGVLFLPSHPAIFVDPIAVSMAVIKKFPIRPMITDYMYYHPAINRFARLIDALPVPNFHTTTNSLKRKKNEEVFQAVIDGLNNKQNFLVYPAGKTKDTNLEIIGGASGAHKIIQGAPTLNVVLVRTKGLWGSSFSRAFTPGSSPLMFPTIIKGIKHVLKNLILFTPRREIIISFEVAPEDFPYKGTRIEINKYLESWYNQPDGLSKENNKAPGDTLVLVPYSIWNNKIPKIEDLKAPAEDVIPLDTIPKEVQELIINKLSEVADIEGKEIKSSMILSSDLGLDSLDMAELVVYLDEKFDVKGVTVTDLTTVNKLMGYAAKKITTRLITETHAKASAKWEVNGFRTRCYIAPGHTIPEAFFNVCSKRGKQPACSDDRTGILTYSQMKLRAILLAEYIRKLPGEYIGILLPSSAGTAILILAVQLAGKVPLMINWTVGSRHLESVVSLSKIEVVLTSWTFLDRLENVELKGIEEKLLMLEDVRPHLGIKQKLKALWRSKQSNNKIFKKLGFSNNPENVAVLLFTSGTESMPKGVPLKHANILSNLRASLNDVEIFSDDVFLAMLPPFHSFGFTVSSLLGVLSGFRTTFYPNPTDGKGLTSAFERWGATLICGAPTFIKGMLKVAKAENLKKMRLCVTGAEKAPLDLFQQIEKIGKKNHLLEGYGITECSPVLTINRPNQPHKGVGQPLSNVELMIVHPETLEILPPDTQGLILARGPNVFSGYLNPGVSNPFVMVDGKEWYKTGDLGFLDANNALTISGRMKRFVKIGGEMISLASVENVLLHVKEEKGWDAVENEGPLLAMCANEVDGEKTKLYLFTRFETTVDEVNKTLKEGGFSNLVKVNAVYKLDSIPIMGTGKVNYRLLENQYLNKA